MDTKTAERRSRDGGTRAPAWRLLALLCSVALVACDGEGAASPAPDAGSEAAVQDSCWDFCPDPDDPKVHFVSADPNECNGIELDCEPDQNGFDGACGCGCIDKGEALCPACDDPSITWMSVDPSACPVEPPECEFGEYGFSNSCGCGCVLPGG